MTSIQPFHIDIPDETLERIHARVADYPWHEMPDDGGWEYGTNLDYMKQLCAYWVEEFDWRKQEGDGSAPCARPGASVLAARTRNARQNSSP